MDLKEAKEKASRCLECKKPKCVEGCPINQNIPKFIKCIKEEKLEEAYRIILEKSYFGSVCGRVCAHDNQCKGNCVLGIKGEGVDIGALEAFVSDWGIKNNILNNLENEVSNKRKVAVVGAGPAGLSCAMNLKQKGYDVTLFDKSNNIGGILQYAIPEDRLSKGVVYDTIDSMAAFKFEFGTKLGKDFTVDDLFKKGYEAVFLGIGCENSRKLNLVGKDKKGVYFAKDFLKKIDEIEFENVIVIGGGNVAMDVARMAKLKKENSVNVLYRKSKENMKANDIEIQKTLKSGVNIITDTVVEEVIGNEKAEGVKTSKGTFYEADTIVVAIGTVPDTEVLGNLKLTDSNLVAVNEFGETSKENVFAGGDLTNNLPNVSTAIKSALVAVEGIDRKIRMNKKEHSV